MRKPYQAPGKGELRRAVRNKGNRERSWRTRVRIEQRERRRRELEPDVDDFDDDIEEDE